jgi:hypothetical protein
LVKHRRTELDPEIRNWSSGSTHQRTWVNQDGAKPHQRSVFLLFLQPIKAINLGRQSGPAGEFFYFSLQVCKSSAFSG